MSSNTKKLIILTAILLVLSGVFSCLKRDTILFAFPFLNGPKEISKSYPVNGKFHDISVETDTGKVSFSVAKDGKARVVRTGNNALSFSVMTSGGKLRITEKDRRPWFLRFGTYTGKSEIQIYLPEKSLDSLKVQTDTGSVHLQAPLQLEDAEIKTDTGSIHVASIRVSDNLKIKTDTGSIHLTDINTEDLTVKSDTGSITLKNVIASETMKIESDTGSVDLEKCDGGEISIQTDTGRVNAVLLSDKVFSVKSDTGRINVPESGFGGSCKIETDTGSITVTIESSYHL